MGSGGNGIAGMAGGRILLRGDPHPAVRSTGEPTLPVFQGEAFVLLHAWASDSQR